MSQAFCLMLHSNPGALRTVPLGELICNDVRAEEAVLGLLHPGWPQRHLRAAGRRRGVGRAGAASPPIMG